MEKECLKAARRSVNFKEVGKIQLAVFLYSIVSVLSKRSAMVLSVQGPRAPLFIAHVALLVLFLGLYAVVWQGVLKETDLSIAYIHKGFGLFWTLLWSMFLFQEELTWNQGIGLMVLIAGIILVTRHD
ncbi:hypothetical protein ABB02_00567 [Clostridiaceae bacterium JG1575]|nr:hypothetical protein ABB02_00567 [Clostridiaceae bacterium JG1575]